jgi:RNA polymerase sigma factor (sigma-70 family)
LQVNWVLNHTKSAGGVALNIVQYCKTQGEERLACAQAGCEDCLNAILHENKNLVFAVIRGQVCGEADLDDLAQEGWIGLWWAIKLYDPARGVRFSTFAWQGIRYRIWNAVKKVGRVDRWQESGGPYTDATGVQLNIDWEDVQIHEALEEGLSELSERERQILLLRYGWDGSPPQTFAEISQTLGWTRQTRSVHQIHNEGLSLLRAPALSIRLRSLCQRGSRGDYRQALRQNREWRRTFKGRK